jgi:hypothetical protein
MLQIVVEDEALLDSRDRLHCSLPPQGLRAECPMRDHIVAAQDRPFPTNPVVRDAWRQYVEAAAGKADAELCKTPAGQQALALIGFECSSVQRAISERGRNQ